MKKYKYKSTTITFIVGMYWAYGQAFKTLKAAKKTVDEFVNDRTIKHI